MRYFAPETKVVSHAVGVQSGTFTIRKESGNETLTINPIDFRRDLKSPGHCICFGFIVEEKTVSHHCRQIEWNEGGQIAMLTVISHADLTRVLSLAKPRKRR